MRCRATGIAVAAMSNAVADLLAPPAEWAGAFDLVVECNNVQALPRELRDTATAAVASFVAPGGTLLVVAAAATAWGEDGPPWPLTARSWPGSPPAG